VAQVVEPSKQEAPSSNPSTAKNKKKRGNTKHSPLSPLDRSSSELPSYTGREVRGPRGAYSVQNG
jgi:hypothetical protein